MSLIGAGRRSCAGDWLLFPGASPSCPFLFLPLSSQVSFFAFQSFLPCSSGGGTRRSWRSNSQLLEWQCYQAGCSTCFSNLGLRARGLWYGPLSSSPAQLFTHGAFWTVPWGAGRGWGLTFLPAWAGLCGLLGWADLLATDPKKAPAQPGEGGSDDGRKGAACAAAPANGRL